MPVSHMILIALAGVGAGAINAVVGSGTLITFPTLVALGYPPVTSTMSNAVGLVAGGVSGTWGYRRELGGQWNRLRWQIPASLVGAGVGSWLLLHLPETVFEKVVPVLLVLALGLVVVGPRIQEWARRRAEVTGRSPEHVSGRRMAALVFGTFVIGIYGGYFTAAQGIMLIAAMSALLPEDMQRMNAAKNLLSLLVNIVAAVAYTVVAFDRISWAAAGLIAAGSLLGGWVAAHPPPVRGGKQPRILFATQATARPPTFVLFTTGFLEAGYRRFLERRLREAFGFEGSPIRINVRVREKRGAKSR